MNSFLVVSRDLLAISELKESEISTILSLVVDKAKSEALLSAKNKKMDLVDDDDQSTTLLNVGFPTTEC